MSNVEMASNQSSQTPVGSRYGFWCAVCASIASMFLLNWGHIAQQGIYLQRYAVLAQRIGAGLGYTYPGTPATEAFYPIWGYPLLVAIGDRLGSAPVFLAVIQGVLCLLGVAAVYGCTRIVPRYFHLAFWVPYFALCSVKWPMAVAAPLLLIAVSSLARFVDTARPGHLMAAGICLAIAANFRSEALLLLPAVAISALLAKRGAVRKRLVVATLTSGLLVVMGLSPWAIRSVAVTGSPRLSSTNGGGAAYVSLGQLPGNPWGLSFSDGEAYVYAHSRGVGDPWSPEGDRVLREAYMAAILSRPDAFLRRAAVVGLRVVLGGTYVGEYVGTLITEQDRETLSRAKQLGTAAEIRAAFRLTSRGSVLAWIKRAAFLLIQVWGRLVLLVVLVGLVPAVLRLRQKGMPTAATIAAPAVVLFTLQTVFLTYETRQMNLPYTLGLLVVFAWLAWLSEERRGAARGWWHFAQNPQLSVDSDRDAV